MILNGGFEFIFFIFFFLVIGMFSYTFIKNITQWNANNHSPRLTVTASIVTKHTSVIRHNHHHGTSSSTSYYVTFQVVSGDRMELRVSGAEYGMLAEGDRGQLTFQGTRYLSFERHG